MIIEIADGRPLKEGRRSAFYAVVKKINSKYNSA